MTLQVSKIAVQQVKNVGAGRRLSARGQRVVVLLLCHTNNL